MFCPHTTINSPASLPTSTARAHFRIPYSTLFLCNWLYCLLPYAFCSAPPLLRCLSCFLLPAESFSLLLSCSLSLLYFSCVFALSSLSPFFSSTLFCFCSPTSPTEISLACAVSLALRVFNGLFCLPSFPSFFRLFFLLFPPSSSFFRFFGLQTSLLIHYAIFTFRVVARPLVQCK